MPWRFAVGQENQIEDVWPPKREYNAVSSIADEIWQYRTSGNLTIFDKDHDTAGRKSARSKVLLAKHSASLQLLCTAGGNQAKLDTRTESATR